VTERSDRMWRCVALGKLADKEFLTTCAELGLDYATAIEAPMDAVAAAMERRNKRCLEKGLPKPS
jgi:hypothetical protein